MAQPEGYQDVNYPHFVCKLHKALYGLKQAPRSWFDKLSDALENRGFTGSTSNSSLFFCRKNSKILIVLMYVDNILVTSEDPQLIKDFSADIQSQFTLKDLGLVNFYLGFEADKAHQ